MTAERPLRAGVLLALTLGAMAVAAQTPAPAPQQQKRTAPVAKAKGKAEATLPPAPGEQLAAAAMAHFGVYACEFNETVSVDMNRKFDGYLDVKHKSRVWTMKPVLSQTGALRLEDVKGRMLMLQIANKSMVMDTQVGQRVVDNCVHETQRAAMANRKDGGESIGIDPVKAAAAAAAVEAATAASQPK